MLTLDQCIDLCGLDGDDVEALARHASVPEIVAAQMACKMLQTHEGRAQLDCILHKRLAEAADQQAQCGACKPKAVTATHYPGRRLAPSERRVANR